MALRPHSSTSRPRWKQRLATAAASSGDASSTPIIRPTPRTSATRASPASAVGSRACRCAPTRAEASTRPPSSSSIVASPAAIATGLPAIVEPWLPAGQVMISRCAIIAPSGMPDAIPLATSRMSGTTPVCSAANIFPVRPIPVCTSSNTSRMPCWSQSARRPGRKPAGGTT